MTVIVTVEDLRVAYRDMSPEELALLELDRADLTEPARETLDAELLSRNLDVRPRVEELRRERFEAKLGRWNDDDLLQYLRGGPVFEWWQKPIVREQLLRRDMDARTFLGATEREGQEPAVIGELQPFSQGEILLPGTDH